MMCSFAILSAPVDLRFLSLLNKLGARTVLLDNKVTAGIFRIIINRFKLIFNI